VFFLNQMNMCIFYLGSAAPVNRGGEKNRHIVAPVLPLHSEAEMFQAPLESSDQWQ